MANFSLKLRSLFARNIIFERKFAVTKSPLQQAAERQAVKKPFFHLNFPYFPIATTQIEPFKKAVFFRLHI